jgi:hypothetical protein
MVAMEIAPLGRFHIAGQYDRCMTGSLSNGNLKKYFCAEFGPYLKLSHFWMIVSELSWSPGKFLVAG